MRSLRWKLGKTESKRGNSHRKERWDNMGDMRDISRSCRTQLVMVTDWMEILTTGYMGQRYNNDTSCQILEDKMVWAE